LGVCFLPLAKYRLDFFLQGEVWAQARAPFVPEQPFPIELEADGNQDGYVPRQKVAVIRQKPTANRDQRRRVHVLEKLPLRSPKTREVIFDPIGDSPPRSGLDQLIQVHGPTAQ
jgi:hypothetical protein